MHFLLSLVSIQYKGMCMEWSPDQPRHAGVYMEWSFLINLVTQLLEDIFTLWAAIFDQPPLSFPLPSWDLMILHGSGQRMTRKHSSSPIVAGGNSGGNPTVKRIHDPAFRLYR